MEEKALREIEKSAPSIPGFGVAGMVMCPFMSLTHPAQCMKQGCELWVELKCGENFVARCSLSWLAILSTEMRSAIDRLRPQKEEEVKNAPAA